MPASTIVPQHVNVFQAVLDVKTTLLCAGMQPMSLPMTMEVLEEAAAETAQPAPAEMGTEDSAGLRARIKELEMEQKLMQAELDSVSELAQRMDTQLR